MRERHNTQKGNNMPDKNFKSGYEIRESLIGMAIGINQERRNRECENEHLKPEGQRNPVAPYTVDEVLETAEALYKFVTKK